MFITSLPVLFNYINIVSYLEFGSLIVCLTYVIYSITPQPLSSWQQTPAGGPYLYLHATWFGRVPLWHTFWPFFLLFNAMLFYIDYRAANATYTIASWVTMHIIFAMPLIYWTIAVWRSSDKCSRKGYAVAARLITVCAYFEYLIRYLIWKEYPYALFDCRQMMMEYGDCFFNL